MTPDRFLPLSSLAGAAARGDAEGVAAAVQAALAAGCSAAEVREALRMVHLFAGFPRALDALVAAAPALGPPPAALDGDETSYELGDLHQVFQDRGRELFDRVYGSDAPRVHARLAALDPDLTAWVIEDAYGRVLARPGLEAAERERLAVVLLAAQGLRNQLPGHVLGALRCGAPADRVEASLAAAAAWIDPSLADVARAALRRGAPTPRT